MGPDHGAVDHLKGVWHGPALVQSVHDLLPEPRQRPAPELAVDARPLAKLFRQIGPWRAVPSNPENPIKNKAMVGGLASVPGAVCQDEPLKERPFLVRHQVSYQAGLNCRYQLESCSKPDVNPFWQHNLAIRCKEYVKGLRSQRERRGPRLALACGDDLQRLTWGVPIELMLPSSCFLCVKAKGMAKRYPISIS